AVHAQPAGLRPCGARERQLGGTRHYFCVVLSALATALTKLTSLGPQREAIESSITAIAPFLTAAIVSHPGRAETLARVAPQQRVSARTIRSGSELTMYSAESCTAPEELAPGAASAMFRSPNSLKI